MIKVLVFDLDDTLLDTTGLLLPSAALRACEDMINAGLPCTLRECLMWREDLAPQYSHRELFRLIAERTGVPDPTPLGDIGSHSFYNSPIPDLLPLMEGAHEVLTAVAPKYILYLLTSGAPFTQMEKIRATRLRPIFRDCLIVDKFSTKNKKDFLREIMDREKILPEQLLSIGNRITEEIRHGKQLGSMTCHFDYGEHVGEKPERPEDHPDFRVENWSEFISTCRL
jgi:putative hydrolase of the HAD superfamily